ncbi:protein of unknown function [Quadrisphaera granulorum]|uniref:Uncharacterized protein DUF4265 n=1 Tax=Quadrisphaera granulorum TaxID=317664 RepID=A0A316AC17_9ACTN|nr:DUF4265 domain-containing protein [Quadrisphaera granulorum]PWJ54959.1 uncharacterized protein DUF4265 [Quadrisphaera granulorum]SZE95905.1 protein of unknown function [Quadrisphaera granulorum]
MPPRIDGHPHAAWADRADQEVLLPVEDVSPDEILELLPVRALPGGLFEVCALSWWQYGFALGDTIRVVVDSDGVGQVSEVVHHSGRDTYRVVLHQPSATAMQSVASSFSSMGCLVEVYNEKMLSIGVEDDDADQALQYVLAQGHPASAWIWESARFAQDADAD